jgi:hypothetical protein
MAKVGLKDLIDDFDPAIRKALSEELRETLNKRPHVLDISYRALRINNQHQYSEEVFREIYNTVIQIVNEKAARKYASIQDIPRNYFTGSQGYLVYVDGGDNSRLLMAKSFKAIRNFISDNVTNDLRLKDTIFGQRVKSQKPILNRARKPTGDFETEYVSNLELGHVATAGTGQEYLTSPFTEKLFGLMDYGELNGNTLITQYAKEALDKVYEVQADAEYMFKNTTPEALQGIEKTFGKLFVVVTLHTFDVNQQFSNEEATIFAELQRKIAMLASRPLVARYMRDMMSSNTMLEDIEQAIVSIIKTGKINLKRHTPKKGATPKKQVSKKQNLPAKQKIIGKTKAPKETPESSVNLISLQSILNSQLQDVISANMGNGSSKSLLNYRTGRFASSAEVKRLTISKEGMITAFYDYMKNPYGTFSTGGNQEYPRSRDPKLLISKSIRQIAAQIVNNRLRAVLV